MCWCSLDNIAIDSPGTLFVKYFPSTASVLAAKEKIPPNWIRKGKERCSFPLTSKKTSCPYIFHKREPGLSKSFSATYKLLRLSNILVIFSHVLSHWNWHSIFKIIAYWEGNWLEVFLCLGLQKIEFLFTVLPFLFSKVCMIIWTGKMDSTMHVLLNCFINTVFEHEISVFSKELKESVFIFHVITCLDSFLGKYLHKWKRKIKILFLSYVQNFPQRLMFT